MAEGKKFSEEEHKKFTAGLFNLTWSLLDKKDRTKEEDDKMIHAAHASRFHWGEIGTSANFERGEWQISSARANYPERILPARARTNSLQRQKFEKREAAGSFSNTKEHACRIRQLALLLRKRMNLKDGHPKS